MKSFPKQLAIYDTNQSTHSYHCLILPITVLEATLHTSHDPWFETRRKEDRDGVSKYTWEAKLSDYNVPWAIEMGVETNAYPYVKQEIRGFESHRIKIEDSIARKGKSVLKVLLVIELPMMDKKSLNDMIWTLLQSTQPGIPSVLFNVEEQLMLDLLRRGAIKSTLYGHIARIFECDETLKGRYTVK